MKNLIYGEFFLANFDVRSLTVCSLGALIQPGEVKTANFQFWAQWLTSMYYDFTDKFKNILF